MNFNGKVALITGSSFGIGRATALAFAQKGAKLILADWAENPEALAELKAAGADFLFVRCDVSDEAQVKAMIEQGVARFGRLDYAFNNAGIEGEVGDTVACSTANWERTMDINVKGLWFCMKYQIPHILAVGKGSIINCASIAGLVGFPTRPAYVASKHAVVGLSKTTALEYATTGLRVNAICPGVIRTPMIERATGGSKEVEAQFEAMEPMKRMGEPEEMASAVLWLCEDGAGFVTGQAIAVDGGWTAQ